MTAWLVFKLWKRNKKLRKLLAEVVEIQQSHTIVLARHDSEHAGALKTLCAIRSELAQTDRNFMLINKHLADLSPTFNDQFNGSKFQ